MRKTLPRLPSPAMGVAFVALLAALTGTAVALPGNNSVTSGDIRNGQVKTQDIRNNNVRGKDIRNGTVTGRDIRNNSVTGSDVRESSLGTVPRANAANSASFATGALSANTANSAGSVGGVSLRRIDFQRNGSVGPTTVLNVAGLTLAASCDPGGDELDVVASTTVASSQLSSSSMDVVDATIDNIFYSDNFATDSPQDIVFEDDVTQNGKTEFSTPAGNGVSITWAADGGGAGPDCEFTGHALVH